MDLSEYRREYAAYCAASERARYEHHAGLAPELDLEFVRERYADLWRGESIAELRVAEDETPAYSEAGRAGARALRGAAELNYLEAAAREVTDELRRCEAAARIDWDGARPSADAAPDLITNETDAARRRELFARRADALSACDDLRAARLDAKRDAARTLGYAGLRAFHENLSGVGLDALAAGAESFLERTARVYVPRLAEWAARELPPAHGGSAPHQADSLFFERASHLDAHFPARNLLAGYAETMDGLGVRVGRQENVRLDEAERPLKKSSPACFGVRPPQDVCLSIKKTEGGAGVYREFFRAAARAQHFAWTSSDAAERHPEFVYAPDGATREGYARLFDGLFRDSSWLGERGTFARSEDAQGAARRFALIDLYDARRACARLRYSLALREDEGARAEQLADVYSDLLTEATGFRHERAAASREAEETFGAAESLRARLFAASLREHLRARHGRRWFASRAAGDELVDMWNTASRHPAEELARLAWGGTLDFDLLAEELTTAVTGGG